MWLAHSLKIPEGWATTKEWQPPSFFPRNSRHHNGKCAMKGRCASTVFLRENWACNSLNPNEVNKVSLHALCSKGTPEHWPALSFLTLYLHGALEGRYLSCFNLPHSRGLTKEAFHCPFLAYSCPQLNVAHKSQKRLAVPRVHLGS